MKLYKINKFDKLVNKQNSTHLSLIIMIIQLEKLISKF